MKKSFVIFILCFVFVSLCYSINIKEIKKDDEVTVYEIFPDSENGYNIYAQLRVPSEIGLKHLLVQPTKIGKQQAYRQTIEAVRKIALNGKTVDSSLKAVTLFLCIPETIMNDGQRYMAFDIDRLTESGDFGHLDIQICRLIDDVQKFLAEELNIIVPKKVDMYGYSGEGTCIVRFALLHPQYLHAVCAGGTSWSPSLAIDELEGETLYYPLGITNIEKYTSDFDLEQWKQIHFFIDMGKLDNRGSYNLQNLEKMKWSSNLDYFNICNVFSNAFVKLTSNAQMVLYDKLGHSCDYQDYINFLLLNDGEEFVPIVTNSEANVVCSSDKEFVKIESLFVTLDGKNLRNGQGFGRGTKETFLKVYYGENQISDYNFSLSNPSYETAQKNENGDLVIQTNNPNSTGSYINISYKGQSLSFHWYNP